MRCHKTIVALFICMTGIHATNANAWCFHTPSGWECDGGPIGPIVGGGGGCGGSSACGGNNMPMPELYWEPQINPYVNQEMIEIDSRRLRDLQNQQQIRNAPYMR